MIALWVVVALGLLWLFSGRRTDYDVPRTGGIFLEIAKRHADKQIRSEEGSTGS